MTATLKTIASATGFSITTTSRALAGHSDVNETTRMLILQEAKRQGYVPNRQARLLQGQKSQTIALIAPTEGKWLHHPFFSEFIAGVVTQATAEDFDLLLSAPQPNQHIIDAYHRIIAGRQVDGFVLVRTSAQDERIEYLTKLKIPFVVFGRTENPTGYTYIDVDGIEGQRLLTEHFIELGHRRIAFITAPQNLMFAQYRLDGFLQAMNQDGILVDESLIIEGELNERSGHEKGLLLLEMNDPPSAIMCGNDLVAFGVMRAINEKKLRIGVDISVGGFDDIPIAEHIYPGLTTLHQPIQEIGQRLTSLLLQMIADEGANQFPQASLIIPRLIIRGSSGGYRS